MKTLVVDAWLDGARVWGARYLNVFSNLSFTLTPTFVGGALHGRGDETS